MDIEGTELLSALNELLEAERAGARVAMETGRSISAPEPPRLSWRPVDVSQAEMARLASWR